MELLRRLFAWLRPGPCNDSCSRDEFYCSTHDRDLQPYWPDEVR